MTLQRDPRAGGGRPDSPPPTLDRIWRIRAFSPPTPEPPRRARDGGRATAATRSAPVATRAARVAADATHARAAGAGEGGGAGDPRQSRRPGRGKEGSATHARAAARGEGGAGGRRTPEPPLRARRRPPATGARGRGAPRGVGGGDGRQRPRRPWKEWRVCLERKVGPQRRREARDAARVATGGDRPPRGVRATELEVSRGG